MKLYEISQNFRAVEAMLEDDDLEVQQAARDTLEAIQGEFDEKADNIACIIKELKADAEAIKAEADKLSQRAKSKKAQAEWWSKYLLGELQNMGKSKLETSRNVISVRNAAPSVKFQDEKAFLNWAIFDHEDFVRQKEPEIDKVAVKEALKNGAEIPGAYLETGKSLVVK